MFRKLELKVLEYFHSKRIQRLGKHYYQGAITSTTLMGLTYYSATNEQFKERYLNNAFEKYELIGELEPYNMNE